jgi:transposase
MQGSMENYPRAAVERAMKRQEVILRAMARKITWWQAAEILGISDRQMRRWRERYEQQGYDGLMDRRRGKPSVRRVPMEQVERMLGLYREKYLDLNVCHFQEKLREEHGMDLSYTWVKLTVSFQNLTLQIDKVSWRGTLTGCTVTVHQHLDSTLSITHGPWRLGHYTSQGNPIKTISAAKAVEKTRGGKVQKRTFPPRLEIPPSTRDSHFPTATTAAD